MFLPERLSHNEVICSMDLPVSSLIFFLSRVRATACRQLGSLPGV